MKWLALFLFAGCAGRMGEMVTDTGDLSEASSAPRIDAVLELGGGDVILTQNLVPARGDGIATVGEALWVRGSNFGRLPTVTIGGRPAAILARTTDGGLVARVPPGVPVGAQALTVANQEGHGDFALKIRRLVATLPPRGGRLALLDLEADGPVAAGEAPVVGELLRVGADGRAAYVLDPATGKLTVFELPAQGGPRTGRVMALDGGSNSDGKGVFGGGTTARRERGPAVAAPARGLPVTFAAASAASVLMVLRGREVLLIDISSPLQPVRGQPRPLPPSLQKGGVVAGALSPDGTLAAVALEEGNLLEVIDLRQSGGVAIVAELPLAPETRVPVIADVAFAPDGRTIWVAVGETAKSRPVGPQPTELLAVRLGRSEPGAAGTGAATYALSIARRVPIEGAMAPLHLNTGRARPLASGASIRLPPERATVYLTASNAAGGATVFRVSAEDRATALIEVAGSAGAVDVSPDGRWLLVPVAQAAGGLAVIVVPADDRPGQRRTVDLGGDGGSSRGGPSGRQTRIPGLASQP